MEELILILSKNSVVTIVIALLINVLTGLIKMPIKVALSKLKDSEKYTRLVIFLPIIFGFVITILYRIVFVKGSFIFDEQFIKIWLSSTCLSLTIYALIEKFLPHGKKYLSKDEIESNKALAEKLAEEIIPKDNKIALVTSKKLSAEKAAESKTKIILKGDTQNG